jgi:hypothetical protein
MRARALRETVLAAQAAPEKFSCKIFIPRPNIPREPIALPEAIYAPVVARLAKGPCKLGDLLALASVTDPLMLTHDDPAAELIAILVGAHYAMPIFGTAVPPPGTAQTFNALAANRLIGSKKPESGIAVSTAGIGTPLPCTVLQAFVLAHLQHATSAAQISAMLPPELQADAAMGRAIEDILKKDVPVWRLLLPTSSESLS